MIIRRSDIRAVTWRLPLLAVAVTNLIYSMTFKVKSDQTPRQIEKVSDTIPRDDSKVSLIKRDYSRISKQPLFEPSRQPWSPPKPVFQHVAPIFSIPPAPAGYTLVGLVLSAEQHAALFRDNMGRTRIFHEGSKIDGWCIRYIDANGVHLSFDDHGIQMTMHRQVH